MSPSDTTVFRNMAAPTCTGGDNEQGDRDRKETQTKVSRSLHPYNSASTNAGKYLYSSEYLVKQDLEIVDGPSVTVEPKRASWLEHPMTFTEFVIHPCQIVLDSPLPSIFEGSEFVSVFPNLLIFPVGEERRVKVDHINGFVEEVVVQDFFAVSAVDRIYLRTSQLDHHVGICVYVVGLFLYDLRLAFWMSVIHLFSP